MSVRCVIVLRHGQKRSMASSDDPALTPEGLEEASQPGGRAIIQT
jgi:hypothetical protein